MEAVASGALIFVDHMFVPRARPLVNDRHIIYYGQFHLLCRSSLDISQYFVVLSDNNNKTDIFYKLDAYRKASAKPFRDHIAISGYLHAMKFHRAANLADYVFRTLHTKQLLSSTNKIPSSSVLGRHLFYTGTGYDLRNEAIRRQQAFHAQTVKDPLALLRGIEVY
jgi:hypothetical protein